MNPTQITLLEQRMTILQRETDRLATEIGDALSQLERALEVLMQANGKALGSLQDQIDELRGKLPQEVPSRLDRETGVEL